MMKKVLVTGADGFIGSHLTEALVRAGHDVRAFVLYNSFNSWGWLDQCSADVKGRFDVFAGDIRDPHGVKEAMKGCDGVLHLAALIAIPYSYHSPDTYVDTNVKGTLNVLQAARELSVRRVIHTSTSEVYGTARFVPITEEHPLQGQSPYSATKIAADQPPILLSSFGAGGDHRLQYVRSTAVGSGRHSHHHHADCEWPATDQAGAVSPTRDFQLRAGHGVGIHRRTELRPGLARVNFGSNFEISVGDTARLIAEVMNARSRSFRTKPAYAGELRGRAPCGQCQRAACLAGSRPMAAVTVSSAPG
jgi:dTDP-glucose 4,6-dehydratase